MEAEVREEQELNALLLIVMAAGMKTEVREKQPLNALLPIMVAAGMETEVREEQYQNAYVSIVMAAGIVTNVREEQELNAQLLIVVAAGMETNAREEQERNAEGGMAVSDMGAVYVVAPSQLYRAHVSELIARADDAVTLPGCRPEQPRKTWTPAEVTLCMKTEMREEQELNALLPIVMAAGMEAEVRE